MKARDIAHYVIHKIDQGTEPQDVLQSLEVYLEKMNRLDLYPLVLKYTKTLLKEKASKNVVQIVSPYEVESSTAKVIVEKLTHDKVAHVEEVNADMIGGFEAMYKDKKVGINFKNNIETFKKHLTK